MKTRIFMDCEDGVMFLDRRGRWVNDKSLAAQFDSEEAARKFAENHGQDIPAQYEDVSE